MVDFSAKLLTNPFTLAILAGAVTLYCVRLNNRAEDKRDRDKEARAATQLRTQIAVELLNAIRSHCEELRKAMFLPNRIAALWLVKHLEIVQRVDRDPVRLVLPSEYSLLMGAIRIETDAIRFQTEREARFSEEDPREPDHYRADLTENVCVVIDAYAPLIERFGDRSKADELRRSAQMWRHDSERRLYGDIDANSSDCMMCGHALHAPSACHSSVLKRGIVEQCLCTFDNADGPEFLKA